MDLAQQEVGLADVRENASRSCATSGAQPGGQLVGPCALCHGAGVLERRSLTCSAAIAGLLLSACGSTTSTTPGHDGGLDGGQTDAGPLDGTTVDTAELDGGSPADGAGIVVCTGPLQDAGFSTLAQLPVASMCAASARPPATARAA